MKKTLAIVLITCLISSTLFIACEKKSKTEASNQKEPLRIAIWDTNQEPGLRQILDDFTAATKITTEIQITPWTQYWTMLEAGATGGSLPDVFWMHSNEFAKYSTYNMLLDLTDRINSSDIINMDKFPQDIANLYNFDGKQFAIPKDIDTIALWYNKTLFDEANLAYPDKTWTWDTFRDACEKLTKADGSQYGFALKTSNDQAGWQNIVYSMGGEVISTDKKTSGFNNPNTIKAIEFVSNLAIDGLMPPYAVLSENDEEALFGTGTVAMVTMGSWMVTNLLANDYTRDNSDIAVLPMDATTGKRVSMYNGLGWAAAANTDKPEKAWQLLEYLGSKEAQQKQSDLGIVISAYDGTYSNWANTYPEHNLQAYLDMMDNIVFRPYSENTLAWENMIKEKLINAWTGKIPAKEVSLDISNKMNTFLAEE